MNDLLNSVAIGFMPDEEESEETQEEVNERNLFLVNQRALIKSLSKRMSKYSLDFLFEQLEGANDEFWSLVYKELIQVYSLNALKVFLSDGYNNPENVSKQESVKSIVKFIKIDLIGKIVNGEIDTGIGRYDLEELFENKGTPYPMTWFIKFTDNESLESFIIKIFQESKLEYEEV